jgi:hypothetical protein
MLVIKHRERAGFRLETQHDLPTLQYYPVSVSQHGNQDFVGQRGIRRAPVDVEKIGIHRRLAVFEDIHPPGIVGAHDADMIRHDVEYVPHAVRTQLCHEPLEVGAVADFGVE